MKNTENESIDKAATNLIKEYAPKITENDARKVVDNEEEIKKKIGKLDPSKFKKLINTLKLFMMLVKDYWNKKYTEIPWGSICAIVFAILYFYMPFDLIPDFLLPFGLLDDAAVVGLVLAIVNDDLRQYAKWKDLDLSDYFV